MDVKTSPTDHLKPIFTKDDCPEGYDLCGRRILHRDGRPGYPKSVMEFEQRLFKKAMKRYTKRTHLKINVPIWSFPHDDTWPMDEELRNLNELQGFEYVQRGMQK